MFRILLGVVLSQVVAAGLMWLNANNLQSPVAWVSIVVPTLAVALVTTFWFGALSRQSTQLKVSRLREEFAQEKQRIVLDAERAKAKMLKKTQAQFTRETKRTQAKASFKVGAVISGAIGFGVFMMFTQFITAGLIVITSASSLLGGYMWRLKRERKEIESHPAPEKARINSIEDKIEVEEVTATHRELPTDKTPKRARIIEAVPAGNSNNNRKHG